MRGFEDFYGTEAHRLIVVIVIPAGVEDHAYISAVHTTLLEEQSCSVCRDSNRLTQIRKYKRRKTTLTCR